MDTNTKIKYGYKYNGRIWIQIQRQNIDTNTKIEHGYKCDDRI